MVALCVYATDISVRGNQALKATEIDVISTIILCAFVHLNRHLDFTENDSRRWSNVKYIPTYIKTEIKIMNNMAHRADVHIKPACQNY